MYIYLVRHGQSIWNAEERHQGWQDVPLSTLGEQQAERIGQRLKDQSFDYYFTSPIKRCYQTAEAIVQAQGKDPATTLQTLDDLREARMSAGQEGLLVKDMVKSWTEEQKRRFRDDYTFKFDDGESVQEVMERTIILYNWLADLSESAPQQPEETEAGSRDVSPVRTGDALGPQDTEARPKPKTALVVAHRINIQLLLLHTLGATDTIVRRQTNIDRLEVSNCALSAIEVNLKSKEPLYRTLMINDVSHLAGLKPPPAK